MSHHCVCVCVCVCVYVCVCVQTFSQTQKDNVFSQAVFTRRVWEKAMDMYEDGALKDQNLNKKHLTSIPEFKQSVATIT